MAPSHAPGGRDLRILLSSLTTTLHPDTFVFITMPDEVTSISVLPLSLNARMAFQESEGLTIVTTRASADSHGLQYSFPSRMITLNVSSSLEAVGFIARVASQLAEKGIGANPVSGFFHDHLFVAEGQEEEAIAALKNLAEEGGREQESS
jgi:uncharacterized protein